jgi:hypothetical protein
MRARQASDSCLASRVSSVDLARSSSARTSAASRRTWVIRSFHRSGSDAECVADDPAAGRRASLPDCRFPDLVSTLV